ncbi:MAG: glycosyltransferase [Acidobacteria bacterium]|nr:glycosyltransferase [Acidobacteriota bacterium]
MAKVSLIIPTFNRPHLLPRAVESAHGAGEGVEVIVVDDGSVDETARVCRTLPGIRYVRLDRNQGVAGARNVGLLESTGDYVAFLDDDDLRLPDSLARQVALLESAPEAGLVASAVLLADENCVPNGEVAAPRAKSGDVFWQVLELNLFLLPDSVLVRKSCFFEVGLFNRRLAGIDDWDMWARIAELRPFVIDERPVSIYRSPSPTSGQGSSHLARHLHAAFKHQARLLKLPRAQAAPEQRRRAVRAGLRRRVSDTLSWRAAEQLPRGHVHFATSNFLTALRISPLWAARPTHLRVFWKNSAAQLRRWRGRPEAPDAG